MTESAIEDAIEDAFLWAQASLTIDVPLFQKPYLLQTQKDVCLSVHTFTIPTVQVFIA